MLFRSCVVPVAPDDTVVDTVVAVVAEVAEVAVAALPEMLMPHVPEAPVPVSVGAYEL